MFTSLHLEQNPRRWSEILDCLKQNLDLGAIDEVCVLLEDVPDAPVRHEKLRTKKQFHRPTYEDYLRWVNEIKPAYSDLCIFANSDIYFDNSIAVLGSALKPTQCAVLSRWDANSLAQPSLFDRNDSQDAWVFKGPPKTVRGDFCVGVPRCDNRFLHELREAGYEVINPAFSIRAYHLHEGARTEYDGANLEHFIDPPYAYLWPHNLWSLPRTALHNLRHPEALVSWRLDRRKLTGSLPVRAIRKVLSMLNISDRPAAPKT
ncbi:hypothetical protein [Elongatibacter sediminis]|uniref:Uncharacterized protein n=1 Tax=Elongatibacter sediminis TaxID=3119006 RepID=A0AAW9R5K4_9GAMM